MKNRRKFLRLEVADFLEIRPVNESASPVKGKSFNLTLMGICFYCEVEWEKGQVVYIDYFMSEDSDSAKIKVAVVWSEFISDEDGFLIGAEIIDIEQEKELRFINYYFNRLKDRFFK